MFKKVMMFLVLVIVLIFCFDFFELKSLKDLQNYVNLVFGPLVKVDKLSNTETTIILTGDIMLGRGVMDVSLSKNDPNYPFEKIADVLKESDIVFGNLENPVIADCPQSNSGFKFCADTKMVGGLKYANIDIVNLGNNHAKNYGEDGLKQTEKFLNDAGIDYVGADNLVVKKVSGTRFGFLGFDFVTKEPKDLDFQLVRESKKKTDVLIVMVHWGIEYSSDPTNLQKIIADRFIKAGADVIVGSHPHWVQDINFIDGKPIFYSLGNFIFDQPWSEETKNGLAIRLIYDRDKLLKIEKLPIYMKSFAQPEWSSPSEVIWQ
jgi:poly-gamma-glutamate capsule biosynthesis protein CapA/YwtB (metallophosphatase superfamily)